MWVESSLLARTGTLLGREVTECDPLHCEAWIIRNHSSALQPKLDRKQSTTGEDKADSCNLVLLESHAYSMTPITEA